MGRKSKERIAKLETTIDNLTTTMIRYGIRLDDLYKQVVDLAAMVEKSKEESK